MGNFRTKLLGTISEADSEDRSPAGFPVATSTGYGSRTPSKKKKSEHYESRRPRKKKKLEHYESPTGIRREIELEAIVRTFRQCDEADGEKHRMQVAKAVSRYRSRDIVLEKPTGSLLKIGQLDDTIYKKKKNIAEEWGEFYLPDEVTMEVMGVVEDIPCPCGQLVLMTCEDKKLYVYDGEELHKVASSMEELFDKGIQYPSSERFYRGEPFKDMTEKDWAEVRESDVGKKLEEKHLNLVMAHKSTFMDCFDGI